MKTAAERMCITLGTARFMLKSIFSKTESHRHGNVLTFENDCGINVNLAYVPKHPPSPQRSSWIDSWDSVPLKPGDRTRTLATPEIVRGELGGGYSLYVCPLGWRAVDPNGELIKQPNSSFQCKRVEAW